MQESISAVSASRRINGLADNEGLRLKPLKAEDFFSPEQFIEADQWNVQRLNDARGVLRNSMDLYDPQKHHVPFFVAQMAVYNYEAILNRQRLRTRIINGELIELTEFGLVRVLEFNSREMSSLPKISGLGELTRLVSSKYRTMIEIRD